MEEGREEGEGMRGSRKTGIREERRMQNMGRA